ncbi:hypothetical protein [Pandoraea apista]|uniref:hypothetical protein n=2 Tax=Pandoraea apista TaxID=93218 RepID=UPI00163AACAB|nr:hypothetical protein [Pandoraea apista]
MRMRAGSWHTLYSADQRDRFLFENDHDGLVAVGVRVQITPLTVTSLSDNLNRTVVITVIAMRMMEMTVNQVVDMIAVRNRFVAAAGPVYVTWFMTTAARRTLIRILGIDLNAVFVDVITVRMM